MPTGQGLTACRREYGKFTEMVLCGTTRGSEKSDTRLMAAGTGHLLCPVALRTWGHPSAPSA